MPRQPAPASRHRAAATRTVVWGCAVACVALVALLAAGEAAAAASTRIRLASGTVLVGVVERETGDTLWVRTAYGLFPVRKDQIKARETIPEARTNTDVRPDRRTNARHVPRTNTPADPGPVRWLGGDAAGVAALGAYADRLAPGTAFSLHLRQADGALSLVVGLAYRRWAGHDDPRASLTVLAVTGALRLDLAVIGPVRLFTKVGAGLAWVDARLPAAGLTAAGGRLVADAGLGLEWRPHRRWAFSLAADAAWVFERGDTLLACPLTLGVSHGF